MGMPRTTKILLLFAFLLLCVALALPVGSKSGDRMSGLSVGDAMAATAAEAATSGKPSVKIVSPAAGATLPAGDVTVKAEVANFKIVDKQGEKPAAGEGHIHYYLDVTPPTAPGKPAVPKKGNFAHSSELTYTFKGVTAGKHELAVELVRNDHTPLKPAVVDSISVNVQAAGGAGM